jgi:hypothetical protein
MARRPAVFDRQILSLDVAGFAQSLEERGHKRVRARRRRGTEDADHRPRLLLRAGGERHREEATCNAADEHTPIHH